MFELSIPPFYGVVNPRFASCEKGGENESIEMWLRWLIRASVDCHSSMYRRATRLGKDLGRLPYEHLHKARVRGGLSEMAMEHKTLMGHVKKGFGERSRRSGSRDPTRRCSAASCLAGSAQPGQATPSFSRI